MGPILNGYGPITLWNVEKNDYGVEDGTNNKRNGTTNRRVSSNVKLQFHVYNRF
jgi:hypothetical protein